MTDNLDETFLLSASTTLLMTSRTLLRMISSGSLIISTNVSTTAASSRKEIRESASTQASLTLSASSLQPVSSASMDFAFPRSARRERDWAAAQRTPSCSSRRDCCKIEQLTLSLCSEKLVSACNVAMRTSADSLLHPSSINFNLFPSPCFSILCSKLIAVSLTPTSWSDNNPISFSTAKSSPSELLTSSTDAAAGLARTSSTMILHMASVKSLFPREMQDRTGPPSTSSFPRL
mmetsp:Transcript_29804/g.67426  ORF Transcript_29804/g.67426 Transcript_29804/m.67426 type:complete len:234 (+) Transcript_29804:328-1029(+)